MTSSEDDYLGFRTRGKDSEATLAKIREAINQTVVGWDGLRDRFSEMNDLTQNLSTQNISGINSAKDLEHRLMAVIQASSLNTQSSVYMVGQAITVVGREIADVSKRIAEVKKQLDDIQVARG